MKMRWTERIDFRWFRDLVSGGGTDVERGERPGRGLASAAIPALLLLVGRVFLGAHDGGADSEPAPPPPAPSVELDRLLKLPDAYGGHSERRGGATRVEWRKRFQEARAAVAEAAVNLKRAEEELDQLAGDSSSWNVAPPGATDPQSGPLNYRLRQEIRRFREEEEQARKALRALEVKADLAGVPADWRDSDGS